MELTHLLVILGALVIVDGIISIWFYLRRKGETWLRNHSVRLVRIAMGIAIMVIGAKLG